MKKKTFSSPPFVVIAGLSLSLMGMIVLFIFALSMPNGSDKVWALMIPTVFGALSIDGLIMAATKKSIFFHLFKN